MVAFPLVAMAELLVAFIGFGVWAHHMFATGHADVDARLLRGGLDDGRDPVDDPDLRLDDDGRPSARPQFKAPLLFIGGFIAFFVIGGLSGIMFAAIPFDQATTDTYFVVAHFHFIIFGAAVFPLLGGIYYWFPKVTGRLYHERLGAGELLADVRRDGADVLPDAHRRPARDDAARLHLPGAVSAGTATTCRDDRRVHAGGGLLLIVVNLLWSGCRGAPAGRDPFDGGTLEWTSPRRRPHYNFAVIPTVSSPYPNWDEARPRGGPAPARRAASSSLRAGHETPATTVRDAAARRGARDAVRVAVADRARAAAAVAFALLLRAHYAAAAVFFALGALALAGWHWHEPEERMSERTQVERPRARSRTAGGAWRSSSRPRRRSSGR